MSKYRALIFDLDDTLYPEREFVLSGFRAAAGWIASNLGLPATETVRQLMDLHDGGARTDTFDRWLERHGLEAARYLEELVKVYRGHFPRIRPFPIVPGFLGRLRKSRRLGLISDGLHEVQTRKLAALGLEDLFDAVVFSDLIGRESWKPSTRPYEDVLARLGTAAEASVYIGDNPVKDFLGARRLGMTCIRVRHRGGYYEDIEPPSAEHAPDYEVVEIGDIERIIREP